jgi:hypothetical protein
MKYSILKMSALAIALTFTLTNCKKKSTEEDQPKDYDYQATQDNATSEGVWDDMGAMSDQASDSTGSFSSYRPGDGSSNPTLLSTCAQISYSWGSPNIITVNFPNFCLCSDGRYRKGKFTVSFTGAYNTVGTVITISAAESDNYYVSYPATVIDSTKWIRVVGTRTVTNMGTNSSSHPYFNISVNATLHKYTGETMTWTSQRTREWVSGYSTPYNWLDDQYSIKGNASGVSFSGVSYSIDIDNNNPLFVDFTCFTSHPYTCKITKGIFTLTPAGKAARTLDFGSGDCDNLAVATVNGITFNLYVR